MDDKKTIGLTPDGEKIIQLLMERDVFKDKMHAAKFAMALAIKSGAKIKHTENPSTSWHFGSFDPEGQIKQVISILYPECETPYRAIESLIDTGLKQNKDVFESPSWDITKQLV